MRHFLILLGLLIPLALDTFALAAGLGLAGLTKTRERMRISLIFALFEGGMPLVGFLVGAGVGHAIGRFAGYTAIGVLTAAGALLLRAGGGEDVEVERVKLLARAQGIAIIDLGISISVDELAIGFSLGLLNLSLPLAIAWIAIQAFVASQFGLWLGQKVGEVIRQRAERLAGVLLLLMAAFLLVAKVTLGGI